MENISDAYTTQVCGRCMNRKRDVGCSKVYECKECKLVAGRDINASRNILLKYMTDIIY